MPQFSTLERLDAESRREVEALLAAVAAARDHSALPDAKWAEVSGAAEPSGFAIIARDDLRAVGYLHALRPRGHDQRWYLQTVIAPATGDQDGLERSLLRAGLDEAGPRGGTPYWWVFCAAERHDRLAAELSLVPHRDVVQMRRPLPHPDHPELPPNVRLRTFRPGHDDESWLEVNRRAFADHPEQGSYEATDLRARIDAPWFDAGGFLLAEDDSGLAGFCWTKMPGDGTGEIYAIGTDPRRQGEGLGRALVLAGLESITSRGGHTATLYVDGDNDAAFTLYEDLGFEVHHVDRMYGPTP